MQFYKFEGITDAEKWSEGNDNRRVMYGKAEKISISIKTIFFNRSEKRKAYLFVSDVSGNPVTGGIIMSSCADAFKLVSEYLQTIELELKDVRLEEITFGRLRGMLQCACKKDLIYDDNEILERFGLDKLCGRHGFSFGEGLLETCNKSSLYEDAEQFHAKDTFTRELDRIYAGSAKWKVAGHPVHYLIQTDDYETRIGMYQVLLQALYANNRLHNKRYNFLNFIPGQSFSSMVYDCLYKSAVGGAIVVRYLANDDTEDDYATCVRDTIEVLCEIMKKYRNQVLTVFCLPRECTTSKDIFYENLGNMSIVELKEKFVSGKYAKDFLRTLAKDSRIRTDKKLFEKVEDGKGYLTIDLHNLFDDWYNNKLKTAVYPQYKDVATVNHEVIKAAPKVKKVKKVKSRRRDQLMMN